MTTPSPTQRFLGGLLMAVGVLMMAACGLCSAYAFSAFASTSHKIDDLLGGLALVGVVGGIPAAMGLGLFVAGRAIRKP